MLRIIEDSPGEVEGLPTDLDELAREGARRMLVAALEAEVTAYVERHRAERDERGHAQVYQTLLEPIRSHIQYIIPKEDMAMLM